MQSVEYVLFSHNRNQFFTPSLINLVPEDRVSNRVDNFSSHLGLSKLQETGIYHQSLLRANAIPKCSNCSVSD